MVTALVLLGGSGERFGAKQNKLLYGGGRIASQTIGLFLSCEKIDSVIAVCKASERAEFAKLFSSDKLSFAESGETRFLSALGGIKALPAACDTVVIHDGARPYLSRQLLLRTIESAERFGSGVAALPVFDTLRLCKNGLLQDVLPRDNAVKVQTPQAFSRAEIERAYLAAENDGIYDFTDDSLVYSRYIAPPRFVEGEEQNVKITTRADLKREYKSGIGFDLHRLIKGRKLVLFGVEIPFDLGLLGHSDADAPLHAVMDAMLSAMGERDIGHRFPDTDMRYKDISSRLLLGDVFSSLKARGGKVVNVSAEILAEKPRLSPYIDEMKASLASMLEITSDKVGISATTLETFGSVGNGEAIGCYATVLLEF